MPVYIILLTFGAIGYLAMRYLYYRHTELFLCLALVVNFDFFYLLPPIGQFYNYSIALLPVIILLLIENFIGRKFRSGLMGLFILVYLFLLAVGIVTSYSNGQPIILGIKAIKFNLLILVFFIVYAKDISMDRFVRYFVIFTLFFMVLADIDTLFFKGKLIFANAPEQLKGERLDRTRFVVGATMISIACVLSFAMFLKKSSKLYAALSFIFFSHIMFVIQTRMTILGIMLTCALLILVLRKLPLAGVFFFGFLVALSIPGIMLFGNFFTEFGLIEKTRADIREKTGSWQGRITAYQYYSDKIISSPIFGYGYENYHWEKNPELRLRDRGIHKSDIGVVHFFYENGFLGFIWFLGISFTILLYSWRLRHSHTEILSFFIYIYSVMPTLDFFFRQHTIFVFGIFLGILSLKIKSNNSAIAVKA